VLDAVSNAAVLGATALFAAGLLVPATTRRVRPLPLLGAAAVAVALVAVAFRASPGLQSSLSVAQLTGADGLADVAGGLLVTAVWVLIAAGYTVRGVGGWRYTWAGLLLFALTLSGLVAGAARPGDPWSVGAPALEALGMLWAVVACHLQLDRLHDEQRDRLHDSELEAETAEVRERLRAATSRTRRHDLVNAITAIDGAAMILEREFDRLSASDREVLASVLGSGTERLRQLLGQEGLHDSVSLADTAAMVAEEPGWHDRVELDLTPGLLATGSPEETAEALRQLMAYACNRAPTGPVTVRSERDGEWAVLRVEDRGPTMSRDERRTVTAADGRRPPGADGGLGLQVAARLMREQGGDLWVEARPGGGSSFGICLPAAAVPAPPPTPPAAPAEKGTGGGHD
jgi:signal transduction histidine kinase